MMARYFLSRLLTLLALLAPSALSQTSIGRAIPGRFIVTYRNASLPASPQTAGAKLLQRHERLGVAILQADAASADQVRAHLAADPLVQSVVEDRVVAAQSLNLRPAAAPTTAPDSLYNSPQGWAVRQVGGFGASGNPGPWSVTTGTGIRIAILDSGIDATHPDLAPNLALNLSEVSQDASVGMPSQCDNGGPQDQQGHGTWTASLAAGAFGAASGLVVGVAPSATLLNIKVLQRMPSASGDCESGQASGFLSWLIAGIEDAVANRADVISMSLGTLVDITTGDGAGLQATFDHVTHAAASAGVILIASAGNDGFNLSNQRYVELPAQSRDVLAIVASTNPACAENLAIAATCAAGPITLPYYSNFGAPLNALAAPGGSYPSGPDTAPSQPSGWIWGACSSGMPATLSGLPSIPGKSFGCFGLGHAAYVQAMGTSASAPLAAGAAALLRAAYPTWTAAQVVAALRSSAVPAPGLPVKQVNVTSLIQPAPGTDYVVSAPIDFHP